MKSKVAIPVLLAVIAGSAWFSLRKKSENTVSNQPTQTEKQASSTSEPSTVPAPSRDASSSSTEAKGNALSSRDDVAAAKPEPAKSENVEDAASATSEQDPSNPDSLTDDARAEKVREVLTAKDSDLTKYVDVQSVVCKGKTCIIEASAKGSPSSFQMAMASQLQKNPWLGTKLQFDTPDDNPGVATFQFIKE